MNLIAALTDLVVGALIMPFNIEYHYYNDHWLSSALKCRIWHFFDVTVSSASIWTLAAIALDRFMVKVKQGDPNQKLLSSRNGNWRQYSILNLKKNVLFALIFRGI